MRGLIAGLMVAWSVGSPALGGPADEIPAPFKPFEPMIGGWKGMATPSVNKVKGWPESHGWAWRFDKGRPVGLTVTFEGDRTLTKGQLGYDESTRKYKLDGVDPQGKPVAFVGSFGPDGKVLTLDRVGVPAEGKERLVVRPNGNRIRYTLQLERQEPGAPQFKKAIEVGLTKDGESFAAGAGGADLPRCIMTGGAAGITVSYQGKSYPVCCTGCRDEFNDNPEKYARLADLAAQAGAGKDKSPAKPAAKGKDDGTFDGLIDEPKAPKVPSPPKAKEKVATTPAPAPAAGPGNGKDEAEVKAAREVQLGQNFEKGGKPALALDRYRKVVKDYPASDAARTASARIKALEAR